MSTASVRQHVLVNGLQLLGEANPQNKSAAIGFFVRTGARDETAPEAGISHFLEHMMFKGTKKRSALDITYHLGNIGAKANAYTSEENTVYYGAIVPEYFSDMQELLCDLLRPSLDQEEFDMEKKVILEEIALYKDRPQFYLFERALADYFGKHSAGQSVLGTTDSVSAISRDAMQDYFSRRYSPSNMTLVASGKFDWDKFVADAERYCADWPQFKATRELSRYPGNKIEKTYTKKNLTQSHILFMSEGCSAQDPERYALALLSVILGDSSGSKLYWKLIDSGLAESAGCDSDQKDNAGCFMAYASTASAKLDQVRQILLEVLSRPLDFDDADLERAKTKFCAKIVLSGEMPLGRLMALGTEWSYLKSIHSLQKLITQIKAVTRNDIEKALQRFTLKDWAEFRLLPE